MTDEIQARAEAIQEEWRAQAQKAAQDRALAEAQQRAEVLVRVEADLSEARRLLQRAEVPITADAVFRVANTIEVQLKAARLGHPQVE